jgi:hypothetical protein
MRVPFCAANVPRKLVEQSRVNWVVEVLVHLGHLVVRKLVRKNTARVGVEHSGHHICYYRQDMKLLLV